MNKTIVSMLTLAASLMAGAAVTDDAWVMFGTTGPDVYLDGTTVTNGEIYAMVEDGTNVVIDLAAAHYGQCPTSIVQLTAADCPTGQVEIYQFDTRLGTNEQGKVLIPFARLMATVTPKCGKIVAATPVVDAPFIIWDKDAISGAIVVAEGLTLDLESNRTGYTVKTTSAGTLLLDVSDEELLHYWKGQPLALVPMSEAGTFGGTLKLVTASGRTYVVETLTVVSDGKGGYTLQASGTPRRRGIRVMFD